MGSAPHCWAWPSHSEPPPAGPCPLGPASFSGGRPPTPAYSSLLPCCGSLGRAPHPGGGGSPGSSGVSEGLPGRVPCHGPPAWARPLPGRGVGWGGLQVLPCPLLQLLVRDAVFGHELVEHQDADGHVHLPGRGGGGVPAPSPCTCSPLPRRLPPHGRAPKLQPPTWTPHRTGPARPWEPCRAGWA